MNHWQCAPQYPAASGLQAISIASHSIANRAQSHPISHRVCHDRGDVLCRSAQREIKSSPLLLTFTRSAPIRSSHRTVRLHYTKLHCTLSTRHNQMSMCYGVKLCLSSKKTNEKSAARRRENPTAHDTTTQSTSVKSG